MISDRMNHSLGQWIKSEHSRLHVVEEWPDSTRKDAVLVAIHDTLARLETALPPQAQTQCSVCASRRPKGRLIAFPITSRERSLITRPAA